MLALIVTAAGIVFFLVYRWLPPGGSLPAPPKAPVPASPPKGPATPRVPAQAPTLGRGRGALTWSRVLMSVVVSVAVLASGLYIILSQAYGGAAEKWAFGTVGTVVGFWLKPST
jgi:hypothetical protein